MLVIPTVNSAAQNLTLIDETLSPDTQQYKRNTIVFELTSSTAQSYPTQNMCFQSLSLPHGELSTGLPQVAALKAVIHHCVVEGRADRVLHNTSLLTTLSTRIRENVAYRTRNQIISLMSV